MEALRSAPSESAAYANGWQAELALSFGLRHEKTVLTQRRQRGPLAVQRPFYPEGGICHAYVLHPPGGVVGGDQLSVQVQVDEAAHALLTTPGATKFYRSDARHARQQQTFNVSGTGMLEWLPQENIFFPGADACLDTHIRLDSTAAYIGWEIHCLGRPVISERFEHGHVLFKTCLLRAGKPIYLDRLSVGSVADLNAAAGLRSQPVMATLLATPANLTTLEAARDLCTTTPMQGQAAATLMNDALIVRYLGNSTAEANRLLRSIWQAIRPQLTGRPASTPRIWNT